jgi:uncharacterized protein YqjF (DUF2071 family)
MPHDFNSTILDDVAHRPWSMPDRPWVMTQTWNDLLFAHWTIDPAALRPKVPAAFDLDLYDGTAWIAIVPFFMTNVAPRGVPALPRISEFAELNVRTYVRVADRPGIYFFSLDAASALAVKTARALFNLPYYTASMTVSATADGVDYRSEREAPAASLRAAYHPIGAPFHPIEGTLEYFLTERYCLYNLDHHGKPYRLDIHHPRWSLRAAAARVIRNTMAEACGLRLSATPQLLHFAKRQDAVAWLPEAIT